MIAILLILVPSIWVCGIALGSWIIQRGIESKRLQELEHLRDIVAGQILKIQYHERRINDIENSFQSVVHWQ